MAVNLSHNFESERLKLAIILGLTSLATFPILKLVGIIKNLLVAFVLYILSKIPTRRNKFKKESICSLRSWQEFEEYTAYCLSEKNGFKAYMVNELKGTGKLPSEIEKCRGDGGVDVVAFQKVKGAPDIIHVVQCKFYTDSNKVGAPDINKIWGTARFFQNKYPRHEIIPVVLTTSSFTREALSQASGVHLYDFEILYNYLGS
jgi:hypothetical protein